MVASFSFTNGSNHDVKDVEITCKHYAPSGTQIDENTRTIYEVFQAHKKKRIQEFEMGLIHSQAVRTNCKITDFTMI